MRRGICSRSQFKEVQELGRYLGADITFPKRRKDKFKSVIEKVRKRLSGWKTSSLSLAGRMTLVKSVTGSMTLYPMQHDRIPHGTLEEIERVQRNFIWGESEGVKKRHAVSWNQLCKPKLEGGVGIKNLQLMNEAFMLKLLWRINSKPDDLWVQVLRGKYGRETRDGDNRKAKKGDSKLWKEITKMRDKFKESTEIVQHEGEERDLIWKHSGSGQFSISSAYKWLLGENPESRQKKWKSIWKLQVPERVRVFQWITAKKKLTTKSITAKWDGTSNECVICQKSPEDQLHALRDCPFMESVWKNQVPRKFNRTPKKFYFNMVK